MKQKLLLLLALLSFLLPAQLSAYNFESGGIRYNTIRIDGDDENPIYEAQVVRSMSGYSGDIVIPSAVEYNGQTLPVTSIGEGAFRDCGSLTSIEIPNSVTSIGNDTFYSCSSLTSIEIPNSVTSIGNQAFYGCESLTSIEIPNSVTYIGNSAFCLCSALTSIEIPNSVTSIGKDAFRSCSSLTSIEIPNSVTSIGNSAFYGCISLTSIEIPNSVTSIGNETFSLCYALTSIEIPNSVTYIGNSAFSGCGSLTSIEIPNSVTSIGNQAFYLCSAVTSIEIPNSVTSIGNQAFYLCSSLTSIEIPNSVTSIGNQAFYLCSALTSIEIPNSVTSIGNETFSLCSALTSIEIPNSVTSIGERAFYACSALTSIEIPNSVTYIGNSAFSGCGSLTSIEIPNSVTSIGNSAFGNCNLMVLIIRSENITFEDGSGGCNPRYVFAPESLDCSSLKFDSITRFNPATTTFLADGTILTDNGMTLFFVPIYGGSDYAIPEGVTKIIEGSFVSMDAVFTIKTLTIPSTIQEIEPNVFLNTQIEKVNFTDWTKWYPNAKLGNLYSNPYWNSTPFVGGVQMVTPELPDGITEIPDYINYGLQFKNEIELPRSIKRIGAYAFYNNKELFNVVLPRNLEEIGESAFEGCELLENPSLPEGLKRIEDGAYRGCTSITEIALPEGISFLGSNTHEYYTTWGSNVYTLKGIFEGCTALEKAVVAVNVDYIADNMFKNCKALDKIYFPLQLKTIGNCAFEQCLTLDEITFPATLDSIGERAFSAGNNRGSISKLQIPDGVKSIGIESFANQPIAYLSIGKGLESIPEKAFVNHLLKVVNFSEGLKEIGCNAFEGSYHRTSIGAVILPSTVTQIGDHAFRNTSIGNLVIPDEVESLGSESCGSPSVLSLGTYIKNIAADAFKFDKLYTIRLKAHMPPTLSDAFPITSQQNDQLTLIVNKGRHDTYNTTARWKQIDRIIEEGESEVEIYLDGTYTLAEEIRIQSGYMPSVITKMMVDGPLSANDLRVIKENMISLTSLDLSNVTNLTALPERQFEGSLLTNVVLPSNLESIGDYAFNSCRLLELTELPKSVKTIGTGAFSSCPSVNIKVLPAALETIGSEAFSGSGMMEVIGGESLAEIREGAFENCTLLERVDLSATALTRIADRAFSGCHELDEVILPSRPEDSGDTPTRIAGRAPGGVDKATLPSGVEEIGNDAFSGTALRNIDFASGVTKIGENAFRSNRRLVSATLPDSLSAIGSYLFADCPRLISLSMPGGVTSVGTKIVSNDRKLANISCASPEAPDASTGAFDDVRFRYVTLTIPTLSFRKYLSAAQWGKFESTKNTIKVSISRGVSVTSASENEYQDMLTEDALEAAQEAAAAQSGDITPARAMRRAAARAATTQNFASLFDGAQLMSGKDGCANRVFITPDPGVNITSILLDGEELISSYDGESILLPQGKSGSLEIITDAPPKLAERIILSALELNLTKDETATLTAIVQPADADDKTVTWTSSDESIAVVDKNGALTIVGVGKATITASCGEVSSECTVKCYPQLGDANWNGNITIADAVDISNYVVKKKSTPEGWDKEEWTEFYVAGANANRSEDGNITFADASATVKLALDQPAPASTQYRIGAAYSNMNVSSDALVIGAVSETTDGRFAVAVNLDNAIEYVALQADIIVPEGMTIEVKAGTRAANHSLQTRSFNDNHLRVALFNLGNKAFADGNDPLFEIVADSNISDVEDLTIFNILAADSEANEYVLDSRTETGTGVAGVSKEEIRITKVSEAIHVYNANGNRIEICTLEGRIVSSFVANDTLEIINLPAGIYIVKAADKTLKVIL